MRIRRKNECVGRPYVRRKRMRSTPRTCVFCLRASPPAGGRVDQGPEALCWTRLGPTVLRLLTCFQLVESAYSSTQPPPKTSMSNCKNMPGRKSGLPESSNAWIPHSSNAEASASTNSDSTRVRMVPDSSNAKMRASPNHRSTRVRMPPSSLAGGTASVFCVRASQYAAIRTVCGPVDPGPARAPDRIEPSEPPGARPLSALPPVVCGRYNVGPGSAGDPRAGGARHDDERQGRPEPVNDFETPAIAIY